MNAQRGRVLSIMYNVSRRFLCFPPQSPFSNRFLIQVLREGDAFSRFLNVYVCVYVCVFEAFEKFWSVSKNRTNDDLFDLFRLLFRPLHSCLFLPFLPSPLPPSFRRNWKHHVSHTWYFFACNHSVPEFSSFSHWGGENGRNREKERDREKEKGRKREKERDREKEREREREGESEKKGSTKQRAAFFVLSRYLIALPWQPPRNPRIVVSVEQK